MKKATKLFIATFLLFHTFYVPAWAEETTTSSTSSATETSSSQSALAETESTSEIPALSQEASTSASSEESTIAATDEPTTESSESLSENEPPAAVLIERAADIGTEENPYPVTTFQELKDALSAPLASGQTTKYIQLQNDIVYNTTYTYITQSTVIDGNGHALLYSGASYGTAHFSTNANNISVTYKNLTFGNDAYPNSTYYGILFVQNTNVNFTVENVNYTIQTGSQPFWGNNYAGNTLTFKGTNNFSSSGSSYGGEFVEGYQNIIFAEDSDTTVYNDTTGATAVFWGTNLVVSMEKGAALSIEASKQYLFYGGGTMNIQEQGNFSYKAIYGPNVKSNTASFGNVGVTLNFAQDSIGHFTTDVNSFSGSNPAINLNSPDYVIFDATDSSKRVLGTMNPIFRRTDADAFTYGIEYLTASGQNVYQSNVSPNASWTVSSGNISNGYSVVYARYPSITDLSATPATDTDVSSITGQIANVAPATTLSRNVQYKLATQPLYSGTDITTTAAQSSIEQSGTTNGVVEATTVTLPENAGATGEVTQYAFQHLPAGNYYLYAKLDDQQITGYTLQSPWQETSAEVPRFIQVQFNSSDLAFDSPIPGEFGKSQNAEAYTMRNSGNVPVAVTLDKLSLNPESSAKISLVNQFITNDQELILSLVAEKSDSGQQTKLGPLTENEPVSGDAVSLNPFWQSDAQANLYLTGNYSGPMIGPQKVSYQSTFSVAATN
ncbi:hypothetical protein JZO70_09945 [Enterococcus sp. 669A]|uniref:WxL domain-containing protein n=1 Tax=Candidatus Enterococcus moelleringii TaxID=2815325 RepID=A0ABS3LDM1_9ENTE|nr:pectate lyase-like adhesive domain-containing protein [Enterococcus sp. 669A]MBO1306484.1 hypothetical protein [Enterococcus sp. 669A]